LMENSFPYQTHSHLAAAVISHFSHRSFMPSIEIPRDHGVKNPLHDLTAPAVRGLGACRALLL
jgi:hypothetical protein